MSLVIYQLNEKQYRELKDQYPKLNEGTHIETHWDMLKGLYEHGVNAAYQHSRYFTTNVTAKINREYSEVILWDLDNGSQVYIAYFPKANVLVMNRGMPHYLDDHPQTPLRGQEDDDHAIDSDE